MDQAVELQAQSVGLANLEVSLKTKPVATVIGKADSPSWQAAIHHLAHRLTGSEPRQYQRVTGHAWWAQRTGDTSHYATAQARLIDLKLLTMAEEAWQPENQEKVFLAYLHDISSGELSGVLTQLAFQITRGGIIRLPTLHLKSPIPFPPNLFVVATIAPSQQLSFDNELFRASTVIDWIAFMGLSGIHRLPITPVLADSTSDFLTNRIQDPRQALLKLEQTTVNTQRLFLPIMRIIRWLKGQSIDLPSTVVDDVTLYLANAWTVDGVGILTPSAQANATTALDIALAQFILARVRMMGTITPTVWQDFLNLLDEMGSDWFFSKWICQRQLQASWADQT